MLVKIPHGGYLEEILKYVCRSIIPDIEFQDGTNIWFKSMDFHRLKDMTLLNRSIFLVSQRSILSDLTLAKLGYLVSC